MTATASDRYPHDDHPLQTAAQLSWTDRNASLDALHDLEAVLAEPAPKRAPQWLDSVRSALDELQPSGYLDSTRLRVLEVSSQRSARPLTSRSRRSRVRAMSARTRSGTRVRASTNP